MIEKPWFRREFTEEKFEDIVSLELHRVQSSVDMRMELHRCYEIIAEAERMADWYANHEGWGTLIPSNVVCENPDMFPGKKKAGFDLANDFGKRAREFLEKLSK